MTATVCPVCAEIGGPHGVPTAPATVSNVPVNPDLARRLKAAAHKAEAWKERRDGLIREAARNGGTLREIAAAVGMSNPGVLRVIRRGMTQRS